MTRQKQIKATKKTTYRAPLKTKPSVREINFAIQTAIAKEQAKVMSETAEKLERLRLSGDCTVGSINKILIKRDAALDKCIDDVHQQFKARAQADAKITKAITQSRIKVKPKLKVKPKKHSATYAELRAAVIRHYAGNEPECVFCGDKKGLFYLQHIYGSGAHRRWLTTKRSHNSATPSRYNVIQYYTWLIAHNYPDKHQQVLACGSCYRLLISRKGYQYYRDHELPDFSPFAFFNPEILPTAVHQDWYKLLVKYRRSCIALWQTYLNSLASKTRK